MSLAMLTIFIIIQLNCLPVQNISLLNCSGCGALNGSWEFLVNTRWLIRGINCRILHNILFDQLLYFPVLSLPSYLCRFMVGNPCFNKFGGLVCILQNYQMGICNWISPCQIVLQDINSLLMHSCSWMGLGPVQGQGGGRNLVSGESAIVSKLMFSKLMFSQSIMMTCFVLLDIEAITGVV